MPWYELAKLVHFLAVIALFGFFVIYARAGPRLRTATNMQEVRTWLEMLEGTRGMFAGGATLFLLSGSAMAWLRWRGSFAFVNVGVVTLLVMWALWLMVGSRHLSAIRRVMGEGHGAISADLAHAISDRLPWSVVGALNGAALGVLFAMTTKVGWIAAGATVAVAAIIGAVIGARSPRRGKQAVEAK